MDITPDTKDWTWVLVRPCPECGLDTSTIEHDTVPAMIRANAASWQEVLRRDDVRERPQPEVWSPLEYGCHVRDVYQLFDERLRLMLAEDDPSFANWNQDDTAVASRYHEDDPAAVAVAIAAEADRLAADFDGLADDQWRRTGRRSDGAEFTVDTFARYLLHDVLHHAHDVGAT